MKAGEPLCRIGDPADELYVVVRGELKDTVVNIDGDEIVHLIHGQGQTVGEPGFFSVDRNRIVQVSAVGPSEQPLNAQAVEECGAGRAVAINATPVEIAAAVRSVLTDDAIRAAAAQFADPDPGHHATRYVEQLLSTRRFPTAAS